VKLRERESDLLRAAMDFLRGRRILAFRVAGQGVAYSRGGETHFRRNPMAGFPDVGFVFGGRLCCWELKTSTGRLSPLQAEWIDKLNRAGAYARVVRSIDEMLASIEELENGTDHSPNVTHCPDHLDSVCRELLADEKRSSTRPRSSGKEGVRVKGSTRKHIEST